MIMLIFSLRRNSSAVSGVGTWPQPWTWGEQSPSLACRPSGLATARLAVVAIARVRRMTVR